MKEPISNYLNSKDGLYYRFKRVCRLPRCKKIIFTNRKDHHFCEPNHQQEFWREEKKRRRNILNEMAKLQEDFKSLSKRVDEVFQLASKAVDDLRKELEKLKAIK